MQYLNEAKELIVAKTRENIVKFGDRLPTESENGKYRFSEDGSWVGSFWTGLCFLCYELTGDGTFIEAARKSRFRFKRRLYEKTETLDHDTGFLYSLSCVADYKLTGDSEAKKMALDAAAVLAGRFNEIGEYIRAWNSWDPLHLGRIIIDCMYNLPLLFWAAKENGDGNFKRSAVKHADTCARTIVRPDYSTYHTYIFDPETGKAKGGKTFQGYSDESCWSRGQAWAIGGYAYAYSYTSDQKYLDIAKECSKFFIDHLEEDFVPMWDFRLPSKEGEPRDASAASIAASGMLEIAKYVTGEEKTYFECNAKKILDSLYQNYSTRDNPENEGILQHACAFRTAGRAVDASLIYGDYYFAEAVARLLGKTEMYW